MSFEMHTATQINKANSILGVIKWNFRDIKQEFLLCFKNH